MTPEQIKELQRIARSFRESSFYQLELMRGTKKGETNEYQRNKR